MKIQERKFLSSLILVLTVSAFFITGCTKSSGKDENTFHSPKKAVVSSDGNTITFPENSQGLRDFQSQPVTKGTATISVFAPARVVATISSVRSNAGKIVLFDSPDLTSLFFQYKQSKSNYELTSKNLARTKEMFENQAVTAKDLNQAQNDAATARASLAEMEGRLRATGFNPSEIESISFNTAWLIADVPELQLHQIKKGEHVNIKFDAYPGQKFEGRADAIGNILDPNTRTVKVRITVPNAGGKLLPGMFAQVDFGNPITSAYILPLSAVVTVEGNNYLFVQKAPNVFVRRRVTLANSDASQLVVLSGVQDSEKVVTSGVMLLKGLSFGY
ncbi:MAG: efflux RND transporter periplasmic adaptor subunit [Ignavibacteriaceae bacterium]